MYSAISSFLTCGIRRFGVPTSCQSESPLHQEKKSTQFLMMVAWATSSTFLCSTNCGTFARLCGIQGDSKQAAMHQRRPQLSANMSAWHIQTPSGLSANLFSLRTTSFGIVGLSLVLPKVQMLRHLARFPLPPPGSPLLVQVLPATRQQTSGNCPCWKIIKPSQSPGIGMHGMHSYRRKQRVQI